MVRNWALKARSAKGDRCILGDKMPVWVPISKIHVTTVFHCCLILKCPKLLGVLACDWEVSFRLNPPRGLGMSGLSSCSWFWEWSSHVEVRHKGCMGRVGYPSLSEAQRWFTQFHAGGLWQSQVWEPHPVLTIGTCCLSDVFFLQVSCGASDILKFSSRASFHNTYKEHWDIVNRD